MNGLRLKEAERHLWWWLCGRASIEKSTYTVYRDLKEHIHRIYEPKEDGSDLETELLFFDLEDVFGVEFGGLIVIKSTKHASTDSLFVLHCFS